MDCDDRLARMASARCPSPRAKAAAGPFQDRPVSVVSCETLPLFSRPHCGHSFSVATMTAFPTRTSMCCVGSGVASVVMRID